MAGAYHIEQSFENLGTASNALEQGEYEACTFSNCNFSEANFYGYKFIECEFVECDLSNANIATASFQECIVKQSKLLGLRFDDCNDFAFSIAFDRCQLKHVSFYQMQLQRTQFVQCDLEGADFSEANLKNAKVMRCNLLNTTFDSTNLNNCDLRGSYAFTIDPEGNQLKGARFSLTAVEGLLTKYGVKVEKED